jgi:hypothetical protein
MKIISHRGFWNKPAEKNSMDAFKRALLNGFGIETDFREKDGLLVISHDPPAPEKDVTYARDFFKLLTGRKDGDFLLALNIKCDGLMPYFQKELKNFPIENYFLFDASIPDSLNYLKSSLPYFVRMSELEKHADLFPTSHGIWLDAFYSFWYRKEDLLQILKKGKKLAIVSPELHGREGEILDIWELLGDKDIWEFNRQIYLCTDYPDKALNFFMNKGNHEKNKSNTF